MDHNNIVRQAWHGVAMKGSIIQWVLGSWQRQNNIYNVVANNMPLSCTSNTITQGTCVGHGIEVHGNPTRDTFILIVDVHNLYNK
jgi:hypothetical protein